jgi:hypothetical protein
LGRLGPPEKGSWIDDLDIRAHLDVLEELLGPYRRLAVRRLGKGSPGGQSG